MKLVSIIIPCLNEESTIRKLLIALSEQSYPHDCFEVIIADGMSTDNTRNEILSVANLYPDLHVSIIDNHQVQIPHALNCAIQQAKGEYIVRLDAHSIPNPDYVEKCVSGLESELGDNVGGIWKIFPSTNTWIARSIASAASSPLGVGNALYRYATKPAYVDTVPFGSYKRSLFDKIGYFNENLLTNEDYEFNQRVIRSGGKIWLDPSIQCVYFARSTLNSLFKQYWRYGFWKYRMLQLFPSTIKLRQFLPPTFIIGILFLLLSSVFSDLARILLGIIIALYFLTLVLGSLPRSTRMRDPALIVGMPIAITTMHLAWGSGFIFSLIRSLFKRSKQTNGR